MGGFLLAEVEAALTLSVLKTWKPFSVLKTWAGAQCPIPWYHPLCPWISGRKKTQAKLCCDHTAFANWSCKALWGTNPHWGKGQVQEKKELGWRNTWCQLTWAREAEFKLCIQFKAPACVNSQTCLRESAKGINLLLSNTNQDSYPMQFTKSYICAYFYIQAHSQPHFIFCLLYKQKAKNKVCERRLAVVIKHYFLSQKTNIFYHLPFSFLLFLSTYFLARKEHAFENQGKLWPF